MGRFCTFPVTTGEPSQGSRRRFRLLNSRPFAAVGGSLVLIPADLHPSRKVDVKNLAHFDPPKSHPQPGASST